MLKSLVILLSFLFSITASSESGITVDELRVKSSTIPAACTGGQIRRSSTDGLLKYCASSTFANISNDTTLTTKGDIFTYSTSNYRLPVGSDGQVLTADAASTPGVKWATPTSAPVAPQELYNIGLSASVGSNALTIALKQADGTTDCSTGTAACKIAFRSATQATGSVTERSVTSSLSVVVSSGSTLGHVSSVAEYIYVYAIDNAGTVELAFSSTLLDEAARTTTTAEGGAGAADSRTVIYSTTARSNVGFRLIGRLLSTQATAGTWASAITEVSTGNIPKTTESLANVKIVGALVVDGSVTTTVSQENVDWINGNCTNPSGGSYVCTFNTGFFGAAPNCWAQGINATSTNRSFLVTTADTTSITIYSRNQQANAVADSDFYIFCMGAR